MNPSPDSGSPTAHEGPGDRVVADLIEYLDASPSPWHAVDSSARRLATAGYVEADATTRWDDAAERGYVVRDGSLVAWNMPLTLPHTVRIVGAHTDSPGLRVTPQPDSERAGFSQLAVEIYGGALLNSWLDRDLGVAGRVVACDGRAELVRVDEPVARVPQLAIHLDRDVNDRGLVLDRHSHVRPVWATTASDIGNFAGWLGSATGTEVGRESWELCLYDIQGAALLGGDRSLLASARIDNQVSCWAATSALATTEPEDDGAGALIALFDHEEVGSGSATGAAGPLLESVLDRLVAARGGDVEDRRRIAASSSCVSADGAHAVHPNYPERHDPLHGPIVNGGPVIKLNANQRYATSARTAALFRRACQAVGSDVQVFVSRNNMPCGSTIGPVTATRLGIDTVDVGVAQLSMHSARELCGAQDPPRLRDALHAYLVGI